MTTRRRRTGLALAAAFCLFPCSAAVAAESLALRQLREEAASLGVRTEAVPGASHISPIPVGRASLAASDGAGPALAGEFRRMEFSGRARFSSDGWPCPESMKVTVEETLWLGKYPRQTVFLLAKRADGSYDHSNPVHRFSPGNPRPGELGTRNIEGGLEVLEEGASPYPYGGWEPDYVKTTLRLRGSGRNTLVLEQTSFANMPLPLWWHNEYSCVYARISSR